MYVLYDTMYICYRVDEHEGDEVFRPFRATLMGYQSPPSIHPLYVQRSTVTSITNWTDQTYRTSTMTVRPSTTSYIPPPLTLPVYENPSRNLVPRQNPTQPMLMVQHRLPLSPPIYTM